MIRKFSMFEAYINRITKSNDNSDPNRYDYIDMDIIMDTFNQLKDDYNDIELSIPPLAFFKNRLRTRVLADGTKITDFSIYKLKILGYRQVKNLDNIIMQCLNNYYAETGKEIFCFYFEQAHYTNLNFSRIEVLDMIVDLDVDFLIVKRNSISS